ncbi:hypothetical protein H710_00626 [Bartonella bacilliformis Ver097]|uniref:Uncharacterized protein n=1 Tax=Bartonella bacilliformis Ver097 TaxID=1293911 RepID=A0A072R2M7_BARBA|nr:hypothetical protein H710_00626 [Bartonella bacilliformis Ver097]
MKISGGDLENVHLQSKQVWGIFLTKTKLAASGIVVLSFSYIALAPRRYKSERMVFYHFLIGVPFYFWLEEHLFMVC